LQPGDTLVLPSCSSDAELLGHLPTASPVEIDPETDGGGTAADQVTDLAERAFRQTQDRAALRVHPVMHGRFFGQQALEALLMAADLRQQEKSVTRAEWTNLLSAAASAPDIDNDLRQTLDDLSRNGARVAPYTDKRGVVITGRRRLSTGTPWFIRAMDDGDDSHPQHNATHQSDWWTTAAMFATSRRPRFAYCL
jgi:hypothetical protein